MAERGLDVSYETVPPPRERGRTTHAGSDIPAAGREEPKVCMTHRWRVMDSNFRFRARKGFGFETSLGPPSVMPADRNHYNRPTAACSRSRRLAPTALASHAEPEVRIQSPPAKSPANSSTDVAMRMARRPKIKPPSYHPKFRRQTLARRGSRPL